MIDEIMTQKLLAWYERNKRDLPWRGEPNAYHIWVSEIMLQQTRVEAVKGYYARFLAALPTVQDLAEVDDDRLLKLWEGLGYYSRARNLKKAAQVIVRDYGGVIPASPEELLKLPGIGLYTAGAVASIAYGAPVPAVDGNVLRVCARLYADYSDIALEQTKKAVALRLLRDMQAWVERSEATELHRRWFNQAMMELGACVCLPGGAPKCEICPLDEDCLAFRQGLTGALPVKSAKKPRRIEQRHLYILRFEDRLALRRRPPKGLLAGLWELPAAFDLPMELILSREDAGQAVHVFTHVEWHMAAERIVLCAPMDGLMWVTKEELERDYALPSAFSGFKGQMF